jgi:hypothetical protein
MTPSTQFMNQLCAQFPLVQILVALNVSDTLSRKQLPLGLFVIILVA